MMSSGQLAYATDLVDAECRNPDCEWIGNVEQIIDPEVHGASWTCPRCLSWHDTTDDVFEPDPDDARDRWLDELREAHRV